jgi:hypothetical protein
MSCNKCNHCLIFHVLMSNFVLMFSTCLIYLNPHMFNVLWKTCGMNLPKNKCSMFLLLKLLHELKRIWKWHNFGENFNIYAHNNIIQHIYGLKGKKFGVKLANEIISLHNLRIFLKVVTYVLTWGAPLSHYFVNALVCWKNACVNYVLVY